MTLESEVVAGDQEVIARIRNTVIAYEPVGPPPEPKAGADVVREAGGNLVG